MTPERKAWWDCLPTEEKRARYVIAYYKEDIKFAKAILKKNHEAYQAKVCMQEHKQAIKALRKQIAMNPIVVETGEDDYMRCPVCCHAVAAIDTLKEFLPKYCHECGQKLRWE